MKISYGRNRLKDLKSIVQLEESLKNIQYEVSPYINKEEKYIRT